MRFLIDECLTTALTTVANLRGHEAQHVAHVGKAGWQDRNVVDHAIAGDLIMVTNNAADFRKLYAAQPLHPGLIILLPNVIREVQIRLFDAALAELAVNGEPVNAVLEVALAGESVTFNLYDLPAH